LKEFFCYRQHDDTTAPEFFEILLQIADQEPDAAAIYCDCQHENAGVITWTESAASIKGEPLDRVLQYIQQLSPPPLRGVIRSAAIRQAGLVRSDEFRAPHQLHGWLAKLLRWGSFRRLPEPLYYKLDRADNFTAQFYASTQDRKRAAWPTIFTGLLEAAIPLCRTPEERRLVQQAVIYRVIANPVLRPSNATDTPMTLIAECLERLNHEGNTHLLREEELSSILQGLPRLSLATTRMQRSFFQIRQRARLAKLIYPSGLRRIAYLSRSIFASFRRRLSSLWRF
jgi:hypothetical protein